jgi:hypothetical protein
MQRTSASEFLALDGKRSGLKRRFEEYALWTLPRLFTVEGYNENTGELPYDYQSVGAQAVNHLANKLMLTLFRPNQPFFKLGLDTKMRDELISQGLPEADLDQLLATGEQTALKELEAKALRPKLFAALLNLIVLGNALIYLPKNSKEEARVYSIKQWVCRRTQTGKLKELIIRECMRFDELLDEVQLAYTQFSKGKKKKPHDEVHLYTHLRRKGDSFELTQAVDECELGDDFSVNYSEADCPYHVECWNLADENNYGTGLVEDYRGSFAALSTLSEAEVKAAVLASEYRWLVNPAGMTKPEDLEQSENGASLPGSEKDIVSLSFGNGSYGNLQVIGTIAEKHIRVLGAGFLMPTAVTRDAERVTAEEIRQQAIELETGLGGVYTRLATGLQPFIASYLLRAADLDVQGSRLVVTIITGLDALSRGGDLENLRLALNDIASLQAVGAELLAPLNLTAIYTAIFIGRGVDARKYTLSEDQQQANQQAKQQALQDQQAAVQGARVGAQQATQQQTAQ